MCTQSVMLAQQTGKDLICCSAVNAFCHVLLSSVAAYLSFIKAVVPYTWQFQFPK